MALKYKRVLIKISGEALSGDKGFGFDERKIDVISQNIKKYIASFLNKNKTIYFLIN